MGMSGFFKTFAIIDDKEDEIRGLKNAIENRNLWCSYYNPSELSAEIEYPLPDLIFLDLRLYESASEKKQIIKNTTSVLRYFIGKSVGCFGLVLWTKHEEDVKDFKEYMLVHKDGFSCFPIFITSLEKTGYNSGKKTFENLISDLEGKIAKDDVARFFIEWKARIEVASSNTINEMCGIEESDYEKRNQKTLFLLKLFGQLRIKEPKDFGKRFTQDVFDGINELLLSNLNELNFEFSKEFQQVTIPSDWNTDQGKISIAERINTINCISQVDKKDFWPGNVYLVNNEETIPTIFRDYKTDPKGKVVIKDTWKRICVVITPCCEFSQGTNLGISLLYGYLVGGDFSQIPKKAMNYKLMYLKNHGSLFFDFRQIRVVDKDDISEEKGFKYLFKIKKTVLDDLFHNMAFYNFRVGTPLINNASSDIEG